MKPKTLNFGIITYFSKSNVLRWAFCNIHISTSSIARYRKLPFEIETCIIGLERLLFFDVVVIYLKRLN